MKRGRRQGWVPLRVSWKGLEKRAGCIWGWSWEGWEEKGWVPLRVRWKGWKERVGYLWGEVEGGWVPLRVRWKGRKERAGYLWGWDERVKRKVGYLGGWGEQGKKKRVWYLLVWGGRVDSPGWGRCCCSSQCRSRDGGCVCTHNKILSKKII